MAIRKTPNTSEQAPRFWREYACRRAARLAVTLRDVRRDPIANRALTGLMHEYTVREEKSGLVFAKKAGNLKLFFHDLDDFYQWEFVQNKQMVRQNERLRALLATIRPQRESWKVRALIAEAQLLEATTRTSNKGSQRVNDVRY